jgi:hypothetical protein
MRRLLWLSLLAALSACPPSIHTDNGTGMVTVGPDGGLFVLQGASIEIPKGALSTDSVITVTVGDSGIPDVQGRKRISMGYRFSPSSLVFKEPVTISVPWIDDRIPAGVDNSTFDVRRGTGDDPYLQLPAPTSYPEFKSVRAKSDKLGLFWATSPEKPAVNQLTLDPQQAALQVGQTQQFTASVTDPAGNPMPTVPVTFTIVPARVAKVDATGLVTALAAGTATLKAQAGDVIASVPVYVVGDATGPLTFIHENPFPTGNDLLGGGISQGMAYFVGSSGTVLTRTATNQWNRLYSSPGLTLRAAAGGFPTAGVAVGSSGSVGVLVELSQGGAPTLTTFPTVEPHALWFDGTYGMSVGIGNDVIIRRNGQWATVYSPSFETLLDVTGDGAGGFTTVGSRGSLYQYDPATQTWNSLFDTQLNVLLTGAVVTHADGSEAWAIGANKLWHFSGSGWTAVNLPASPALTELTAVGVIDGQVVVAGGAAPASWLLAYNPQTTSWSQTQLRARQKIRDIFGQGTAGYAVGDSGVVWQYAGGSFTELSEGYYGDVADIYAAPGVAVAALNECADDACDTRVGKVLTRSPNGVWEELGAQIFTDVIYSIAARSANEVYVGGAGVVYRYDGTSWTPIFLSTGTLGPVLDLAVCGDQVIGVGTMGSWFIGRGTSLTPQNAIGSADLHAVSCRDSGEIWIAGDYELFRLAGTNLSFVKDPNVNQGPWRAVWSPASGEAFAFGNVRFGVYWDTAEMVVYDAPGGILPDTITGLWGSSVDNLYAVGSTVTPVAMGYALRFNGVQWSLVDSGADKKLTGVSGSSATDIYVGTEGGGILRGVAP